MEAWPECICCDGPALPRGLPALNITFDVETRNESNARDRWGKNKRSEAAKEATADELAVVGGTVADLRARGPWCVRLTRLSPGELDSDGVPRALKAIRDVVASHLGVDDKSPAIAWRYAQAQRREMGVRVEIWGAEGLPRARKSTRRA